MIFTVITTIQSPGNDPVEVVYYRGDDQTKALVAAGQALIAYDDDSDVPVSVRPVTQSVRIDVAR